MLRLSQGTYAVLELDGRPSWVHRVAGPGRASVPAHERQALVELARGLPARGGPTPLAERLLRHGMAEDRRDGDDPVIAERLAQLDSAWRWQRPTGTPRRLYDRIYRLARRAHGRRKIFVEGYGQTPCLPETAARRALLAPPEASRVLCLGDDDLVSIPTAATGREVTVLDIDTWVLLPLIHQLAAAWRLPIQAEPCDLVAGLPPPLRGAFDVVFADPVATRACLSTFLQAAYSGLRDGGTLVCSLPRAAESVFLPIARDTGFTPNRRLAEFNHYYTDSYLADAYGSDTWLLERRGRRPSAKPSTSDCGDLFNAEAEYRFHQTLRIWLPPDEVPLHLEALGRVVLDAAGSGIGQVAQIWRDGGLVVLATLVGGGHLCLAAGARGDASLSLYPGRQDQVQRIALAITRQIPGARVRSSPLVARPN